MKRTLIILTAASLIFFSHAKQAWPANNKEREFYWGQTLERMAVFVAGPKKNDSRIMIIVAGNSLSIRRQYSHKYSNFNMNLKTGAITALQPFSENPQAYKRILPQDSGRYDGLIEEMLDITVLAYGKAGPAQKAKIQSVIDYLKMIDSRLSLQVSLTANWQARTQDVGWNDSRCVTGIQIDTANNRLILNADFNTTWQYYKGEIYIYVKDMLNSGQEDLDMHGKKLAMEVFIPAGFIDNPKSPEHLRLFLKSSGDWAPIYGIWKKLDFDDEGSWISLEFDPEADPASWKDADFNPRRVRELGLAITKGSGRYFGSGLMVRNIRVKPSAAVNLAGPVITLTPPIDIKDFISSSGRNLNFNEYNYGWCVGEFPALWGQGGHGGFSNPAMRAKLKDALLALKNKGIWTVRLMALFGDGRTGILQDREGNFIYDNQGNLEFDNKVYEDVKAFLDVLHETGMKVVISLFDFRVADNIKREGNRGSSWLIGEHPEIFSDPACQDAFVKLFTKFFRKLYSPRFLGYKIDEVLLFWEVMNEPEAASAVRFKQVVNFHDRFFRFIRKNVSRAKVTTSSLMVDSAFRFWKNKVDVISVHHYPDIERLNLSWAVGNYGFGNKRVYWTEFADPNIAVGEILDSIYHSGSSGLLFWEDDYYKFDEDNYHNWIEANMP